MVSMIASVLERFLAARGLHQLFVFFVLGLVFSLLAVFLAVQTRTGFVALFVIAIAILPVINRFLSLSELLGGRSRHVSEKKLAFEDILFRSKRWSIRQFLSDFAPVFEVYLVYFLTVFFSFFVVGVLMDFSLLSRVFSGDFGFFSPGSTVSFVGLLSNNIGVLFLGFLFSFVFEFGATFVVVRNAIFWGLTFGVFVSELAGAPIGLLLIIPHLVLEAASYFVSSIAGGVLSKAVAEEKIESERFFSLASQVFALLIVSIVLLVVAAGIETIVFNDWLLRFF